MTNSFCEGDGYIFIEEIYTIPRRDIGKTDGDMNDDTWYMTMSTCCHLLRQKTDMKFVIITKI